MGEITLESLADTILPDDDLDREFRENVAEPRRAVNAADGMDYDPDRP